MLLRKTSDQTLDQEIVRAYANLRAHPVGSEKYRDALALVERLNALKESHTSEPVSKNTAMTVGANLLSILMIIRHEHVNVIATKAIGLLLRPKI